MTGVVSEPGDGACPRGTCPAGGGRTSDVRGGGECPPFTCADDIIILKICQCHAVMTKNNMWLTLYINLYSATCDSKRQTEDRIPYTKYQYRH